jgi:hypothetical protein
MVGGGVCGGVLFGHDGDGAMCHTEGQMSAKYCLVCGHRFYGVEPKGALACGVCLMAHSMAVLEKTCQKRREETKKGRAVWGKTARKC